MATTTATASATAVPPPTSIATATLTPTFTATPPPPPPTGTPIPPATTMPTATATAVPTLVNGLILDDILILDEAARQNVVAIYQRGQTLGRNPHAFSKLGDSGAFTGHYLTRFDYPPHYDLGDYAYLQPTINWFKNSFERYGVAVVNGMSSWHAMDPAWTNQTWCAPDEHLLACEFRLHNPSLLLIRLGTNDASSSAVLERNLRRIVTYAMEQGVIPVLATKADRFEEEFDQNNEAIRRVAAEMHIPLWDFDRVAATLPDRGLSPDRVHLTHAERNDYTDPLTFTRGYPMNDLTGLLVLHHLRILVTTPDTGPVPRWEE